MRRVMSEIEKASIDEESAKNSDRLVLQDRQLKMTKYFCCSALYLPVQTTTGSSSRECDDVTSRDSRVRRPRVYDWNTKRHFYPDIIDFDEWTRRFVRWNSARWRGSGRHQATTSSPAVQPTTTTTTAEVRDSHRSTQRAFVVCFS